MEQHVVEGVAATLGGSHEYLQVFHHLVLAGEIIEGKRPQGLVNIFIGGVEMVGTTREQRFAHKLGNGFSVSKDNSLTRALVPFLAKNTLPFSYS